MLSLMCRDPHGFISKLVILNVCQKSFKQELTFDTVSGIDILFFAFVLYYSAMQSCGTKKIKFFA